MKKMVCIIILSIILFSVAGCAKEDEHIENYKEMIYDTEILPLKNVQGEIHSLAIYEDKIYFCTEQWIEEQGGLNDEDSIDEKDHPETGDGGEWCSRFYIVDSDGNTYKELLIDMKKDEIIQTILIGKNDTIICVVQSDGENDKESLSLAKLDENGNELLREDVTSILGVYNKEDNMEFLADRQGHVIAAIGQAVYIFDDTFKCIGKIDSSGPINGMALTEEGQVVCGSMIYSKEEICSQVQILDLDAIKWGKTISLGNEEFAQTNCLMNGNQWNFYYRCESGIYGYDIENKKDTKLMDYIASNLESDDIYGMKSFADERFVSMTHDDSGEIGITIYTKVDPATLPDKTTITYGGLYISDDVKQAAAGFNRANREYQIEFEEYNDIEKMNTDIIAGKMTDIIDLSYQPMEQYVEKGILEDLTPYFNSDPEISEDDIIDSVRESMLIDNKLYFISPEFGVDTIIAKTKDVGEQTGWTFDEMRSFLDGQDEEVNAFYDDNKEDLLSVFLLCGNTDYIDWQSGKCSYDSRSFKDILEFCNSGKEKKSDDTDYWTGKASDISNGKVLLANVYGLGIDEIQVYHQMFGDDITYIGYPDMDREGNCFRFYTQVGISAQSKEKEGAWEFVRTFMTKEYQGDSGNRTDGSIQSPTRQDCFDRMIDAKTATEPYVNEFGEEIQPTQRHWWWNDLEVDARPLTQMEADGYINLVKRTKKRVNYDFTVNSIIEEEVKLYFAGKKSLDETVDVIQSRIEIYVNENR